MGVRLPDKAGEMANGDNAAWELVARAAKAAEECQCDGACSLAKLLSDPTGAVSLSEIKDCQALGAEFDPRELVECYCLVSASRGTKPSLDSIMDTADEEMAKATSLEERTAARAKAGRTWEKRRVKMMNLYSSLVESSLSS